MAGRADTSGWTPERSVAGKRNPWSIVAVISILALREQFLPPNINFREGEAGWNFDVVGNEAREAEVGCVISNSFGFGGTNATIVLEQGVA